MVEDDGAVRPAVMVDQAQVGKKTHTHSLQPSLVTQGESITLDLQEQTQMAGRVRRSRGRARMLDLVINDETLTMPKMCEI